MNSTPKLLILHINQCCNVDVGLLSGGSVTTISLHGAVAGSVAPRAHTAFRACNLRLKLPTLLSFINNGELFSAQEEVNIQDTSLTFFNIFNNCFAGCLQKVSTQTFYFLPIQGNPIGPLVPTTVGLKFGSTYNKTTVKYFSLCLFVTNYCQTCINRLLHPRLPDSVVLFLNTVAHRCLTKQNISKHTFAVIDG